MENIDNVRLFLKGLDGNVGQLETSLEPILKKSLEELVAKNGADDQIDRIKILNNFTYVFISVLFSYLKSTGVNTDTHPIMKELSRIKTYMNRLKELEKRGANHDQNVRESSERAKSFLQHTLGSKGTGAAAPDKLASPAISASNFTGKHTKFEDDDKEKIEPKVTAKEKKADKKGKGNKPNRVTKPKRK